MVDLGFLRELNKQFTLDPLAADDPRYVDVVPPQSTVAAALRSDLDLADRPLTLVVAGARGSGKSTQFNRLAADLEASGAYRCVVVDALDYLNGSQPLEIRQLLLIVVADVARQFAGELVAGQHGARERLVTILKRFHLDLKLPGGVELSASAKELKASAAGQSLTIDLTKIDGRVDAFALAQVTEQMRDMRGFEEEVRGFFSALRVQLGCQFVVIVDSIDKFRGSGIDDVDVQRSIARVFVQFREQLRFESHHSIYTVPVHLNYTDPAFSQSYDAAFRFVPIVKLHSMKGERDESAFERLRQVFERRRLNDRRGWDDLMTAEHRDRLIEASGGQLRDLVRLTREVISQVNRYHVDRVVSAELIDGAIAEIQRDFGSLTAEMTALVEEVNATNGVPTIRDSEIPMLARLLEGHVLLAHQNGGLWFEVHPLAAAALDERKRLQQGR